MSAEQFLNQKILELRAQRAAAEDTVFKTAQEAMKLQKQFEEQTERADKAEKAVEISNENFAKQVDETAMWHRECLRANAKAVEVMKDRDRLREALEKISSGCANGARSCRKRGSTTLCAHCLAKEVLAESTRQESYADRHNKCGSNFKTLDGGSSCLECGWSQQDPPVAVFEGVEINEKGHVVKKQAEPACSSPGCGKPGHYTVQWHLESGLLNGPKTHQTTDIPGVWCKRHAMAAIESVGGQAPPDPQHG